MKWLTRIGAALLALVALAAVIPFFVTLDDYVPLVEREISARLNEPVSIDALHASMFPTPHVRAEGIAIGANQHIQVRRLTLEPDLLSLLGTHKVIRSVEFEGVALPQQSLATLLAATREKSDGGTITVERVKLRNATLKLERKDFGPFDAQLAMKDGGRGNIQLALRDGTFDARLLPQGEGYTLTISAKGWTPPLGPAVRFDELKVQGTASGTEAKLESIAAKLYGGTANGKATVSWGKTVAVKGALEVRQVEIKDAAALVSRNSRMSGKLDAKPVFSASAPKASGLDETLKLETPFTVHNGVLHGVDLASAAAALAKQGSTGGETRFDELSGHMVREGKAYRFTKLRISAGGLAAQGHVAIAPSRALSGVLNTSVEATGPAVALPLKVAGTLDAPLLYPSTSALVGAAAGTVVLPGVGTAVGARLGGLVEGLLGKKK